MSTPTSPVDKLPHRSSTLTSSIAPDRRASMSDDEAIPDSDSSEVHLDMPYDRSIRGQC